MCSMQHGVGMCAWVVKAYLELPWTSKSAVDRYPYKLVDLKLDIAQVGRSETGISRQLV